MLRTMTFFAVPSRAHHGLASRVDRLLGKRLLGSAPETSRPSRILACVSCGDELATCLAELGALRCHDCAAR